MSQGSPHSRFLIFVLLCLSLCPRLPAKICAASPHLQGKMLQAPAAGALGSGGQAVCPLGLTGVTQAKLPAGIRV